MNQTIAEVSLALNELCQKSGVQQLEVFGSVADGSFDPRESDMDFLVEFESKPDCNRADQYFMLLAGLENLFGRRIDLVTRGSVRNPYFARAINDNKQLIYAAQIRQAS